MEGHSDKMIDIMNQDEKYAIAFAATLDSTITRENVHEAREKGLLIVNVGKKYLQVAGKTNAIFDLKSLPPDVTTISMFFDANYTAYFGIGELTTDLATKYPTDTYTHIPLTKQKDGWTLQNTSNYATYSGGIVITT